MIKICPVDNVLKLGKSQTNSRFRLSPFANELGIQYLRSRKIIISPLSEADLIISVSFKQLLPLMLRYGKRKKFMLWTNEPRYERFFYSEPIVKYPLLPELNVLNVYTGIFTNNFR